MWLSRLVVVVITGVQQYLSLSLFHSFFLLAFGLCLNFRVSLSALIDHDCSKPLEFGLQPAFHK
jgi:hypothetical protein